MILKVYKYRFYPTEKQKILLSKHFGSARWIHNYALNKKTKTYQTEGKSLSRLQIQSELSELKKTEEYKWLRENNTQSLQASLEDVDKVSTSFFRKQNSYPRFKSGKSNYHSFRIPQSADVDFNGNRVSFSKFKEGVRCMFSRRFEWCIKSSVVYVTPSGKYFISILVEPPEVKPAIADVYFDTSVGIDLGLIHFTVRSAGEKVDTPKHLQKSLKKLRGEQKRLGKKETGSNNRIKQRIKVTKIHDNVTNQRIDLLQKTSTRLLAESQTIAFGSLNVKGRSSSILGTIEKPGRMVKQKSGLNRSIQSASWAAFVHFLEYKAEWKGANIVRIGRFSPSSRLCVCGKLNKSLHLSDMTREPCQTKHHRGILASNNFPNKSQLSFWDS